MRHILGLLNKMKGFDEGLGPEGGQLYFYSLLLELLLCCSRHHHQYQNNSGAKNLEILQCDAKINSHFFTYRFELPWAAFESIGMTYLWPLALSLSTIDD